MDTILTATMPPVLSAGALALNTLSRELTGPAGVVKLDRGPFQVLLALMRRPGLILSLTQLIEAAWEPDLEPVDPEKAMRMRIARARDAMEQVGISRDRLALRFMAGYVIEREPGVVRVFTPEIAAQVDRFLAARQAPEMAA